MDPEFSTSKARWRTDIPPPEASERGWERGLRDLYGGRGNGDIAAPPQTLVQQTKVIQNITNNSSSSTTNVRNLTAIAPLTQVDRKMVKLETVTGGQRAELKKQVQVTRDAAVQRQKSEAKLQSQGPAPAKPAREVNMSDSKPSRTTRRFRMLLRLLPAEFRGDYGAEMEQVFTEQRADAERHGDKIGIWRLWWETTKGVFTTAPREPAPEPKSAPSTLAAASD